MSGIALALTIPVLAWLLQLSLENEVTFATVTELLENAPVRWTVLLLVWALAHHVFAGLRHLLFDIHVGTSLRAARASAWAVIAAELAIVLAIWALL
jgi:succinate dehydrogenase / fumarate reductase cytochrome b subunit